MTQLIKLLLCSMLKSDGESVTFLKQSKPCRRTKLGARKHEETLVRQSLLEKTDC